jgi:hypothetical protein
MVFSPFWKSVAAEAAFHFDRAGVRMYIFARRVFTESLVAFPILAL